MSCNFPGSLIKGNMVLQLSFDSSIVIKFFIPSEVIQKGVYITARVATVREKCLENEIFPRSGKSQGILWMVREI